MSVKKIRGKRGDNKKAALELSFGMIFSVILLMIFVAFAIYAIFKFLDMQESIKIGLFIDDLKDEVRNIWRSSEGSTKFAGTLPSKIKLVCFADLNKPATARQDVYDEIEIFKYYNANLFFWPLSSSQGVQYTNIEYLNITKITNNENPYCIENVKGKVSLKINKGFYDALVCLGDNCEVSLDATITWPEGTVTWESTKTISKEQLDEGYSEELSSEQRFEVSIEEEKHYVGIVSLTSTTATIEVSSAPQRVIFSIGGTKKFDVTEDNYYDIQVTLNNIVNSVANLTIKKIYEKFPIPGGLCVNRCGDGVCQNCTAESCCMIEGCPCFETPEICPEDCIVGSVRSCNVSVRIRENFCGFSTGGSCNSNSDCVVGGCSGQICQGKNQEPVLTTCEWRDCYRSRMYCLECKCVDGKCKWDKII